MNGNPERTIPGERVKVHLFHVWPEPHGRWLVFGFAPLGVLDRNLRRNTSEFSQISAKAFIFISRLSIAQTSEAVLKNEAAEPMTVKGDAASWVRVSAFGSLQLPSPGWPASLCPQSWPVRGREERAGGLPWAPSPQSSADLRRPGLSSCTRSCVTGSPASLHSMR